MSRQFSWSESESISNNKSYKLPDEFFGEVDSMSIYVDISSYIVVDKGKIFLEGGSTKNYENKKFHNILIIPSAFPCQISIDAEKEVT